ncbi:hypothetical protein Tsubulata_021705 [Turnera subulata]|uniref:Major facilitator superfamily (MFS) profile domain-containing protein n=1 Tax=Turnera subulata TaxID=218843 RepID=A0A9Q0FSK7_9ROSI|nr:hypothetical protein Tsubulata_021705 [Turnera subulata]
MAGGMIIETGGRQYPGKFTFHVFVTCIIAGFGGLIFGYDLGISGGVTSMDIFLKKFFPEVYKRESSVKPSDDQYCSFNDQTMTLFTSCLYIAALISAIFSSVITRALGRKTTMVAGGLLFAAGAIVNALAQNVAMLYIGRILLGFGIGCCNQSAPIYISEVAPYKYRGALNVLFQLCITIGILVANIVNYVFAKSIKGDLAWRLSLGGALVPALIITLGALYLPETPNSLLERGHYEKAKKLLKKLRGIDNVDDEFNDIVAAGEASKLVKSPWRNIGKRKYRPHLTFAILIPFFQQFTGMNVIMFYAPVLFKTLGFGAMTALLSTVITGAVNFLSTIVAIVAVDKLGRRFLFLEGAIQMLLSQIGVTIAIALKFGLSGNPGHLSTFYAAGVVVLICVFVAGFAWSWGPLGWLVPSEIMPLEIRSAAQSINCSINMFCTFVIAQIFTLMLCKMKFGLFIFFAFFIFSNLLFIYNRFPETKGIPIEEMQIVWKEHKHWRKYYDEEDEEIKVSAKL